jgi:hypothetical protein
VRGCRRPYSNPHHLLRSPAARRHRHQPLRPQRQEVDHDDGLGSRQGGRSGNLRSAWWVNADRAQECDTFPPPRLVWGFVSARRRSFYVLSLSAARLRPAPQTPPCRSRRRRTAFLQSPEARMMGRSARLTGAAGRGVIRRALRKPYRRVVPPLPVVARESVLEPVVFEPVARSTARPAAVPGGLPCVPSGRGVSPCIRSTARPVAVLGGLTCPRRSGPPVR